MISKHAIWISAFAVLLTVQSVEALKANVSDKTTANTPVMSTANKNQESPAERAISDKIRSAIAKDTRFSNAARNIQIATQGSVVTLSGNVNSESEKIRIKAIAQNADGVTSVIDQVIVKLASPNY